MSPSRNQYLILTFFTFLLGVLGVLAYRGTETASQVVGTDERHADLVEVVEELEARRARLEVTLADLRGEAATQEEDSAARRGLARSYSRQLQDLRMLAGLLPVHGPGLEITLSDNPRPPDEGTDPNNYIIHDYDVRILVNALWSGGAEAIAVNGQRLVGSSAIRCVGATVLVNNARVGSPFTITALGDPARLESALERDADAQMLFEDYAKMFGLSTAVEFGDDLRLPAYGGGVSPRQLLSAEADVTLEAMSR